MWVATTPPLAADTDGFESWRRIAAGSGSPEVGVADPPAVRILMSANDSRLIGPLLDDAGVEVGSGFLEGVFVVDSVASVAAVLTATPADVAIVAVAASFPLCV